MIFNDELEFERNLINILQTKGWEKDIIKNPTEEDLINNWANILFENNKVIDRLNDVPLTKTEMQQIMDQIAELKTPIKLNGFINGKTISIVRDNPKDTQNYGRSISLKIYDRKEIAAGQSRYQIVEQPKFKTRSEILNQRRGDVMLLINGMPLIHIELKKSGIPVSQATNQIEKYSREGVFTGIFSLVQIFVAMTPDEMLYFANPGPEGKFNNNYYFEWEDFNNEPIRDWKRIASDFLSIPLAHQMIGFYTVADGADGVLKVMRSYQYYAANKISDKVSKIRWGENNQLGGYIWHTTGSGKTMTSFKTAQLIANSKDADKVVFLLDRIELGIQTLKEYRNFAEDNEEVQETEDTQVLKSKLLSDDTSNTLIVTSIQKMSNIEYEEGINDYDIAKMNKKRIVFIIDECHRSTFGDMLVTIKRTFPDAIFFGFTGTPIQQENQKHLSTTAMVLGNELHRYSIADGIRDKNVLGFDVIKVSTYRDRDLRKVVALDKSKSISEEEALSNPEKKKIYYHYINDVKMAGDYDSLSNYIKGIEDYIPNKQYDENHREQVVNDILENWNTLSVGSKFHAIFSTSSIPEAIKYYRLFKIKDSGLKISAVFDPSIDNNNSERSNFKELGLEEIVEDYNTNFDTHFTIGSYKAMKKDIQNRLAHKNPYELIERDASKQLNIVIVVNQLLTGYDSKWVNTLYLDKTLEYEEIIQAFSRTNRLFGPDKPFGTIKYYRKPHTMEKNIEKAIRLYSGQQPYGLFVPKLDKNLIKMNIIYDEIIDIFDSSDIQNLEKLPEDRESKKEFAKKFKEFNKYFEASKIQGFIWNKDIYVFDKESNEFLETFNSITDNDNQFEIKIKFNEKIYNILLQRYKELFKANSTDTTLDDTPPYEIEPYLIEHDTEKIDNDYMNSKFKKYIKSIKNNDNADIIEKNKDDLHKTFSSLSQEDQKYANMIIHDIESGDFKVSEDKTITDYINELKLNSYNDRIKEISDGFGLDENLLREMMDLASTGTSLNEYGRFSNLLETVDYEKARDYFERIENKKYDTFNIKMKTREYLTNIILFIE